MWRYIFPIAFLAISALIVLAWLLSGLFSHDAQKEHVFFLEDLLLDKKYQIDLTVKDGTGKEISVAPIHVIPLQVASSVNNDMEPPAIKNVILEEVRQTLFSDATISWETDEPSSSIVEYGLTSKYGERAESEKIFAGSH